MISFGILWLVFFAVCIYLCLLVSIFYDYPVVYILWLYLYFMVIFILLFYVYFMVSIHDYD